MLTLIIVTIFASIALTTWATLYPLLSRRDIVKERLASLMTQEEEQARLVPVPSRWQRFLSGMGARHKLNPADLSAYRGLITSAGFRSESVYIFLGSKLLLAMALPGAYLVLMTVSRTKTNGVASLLLAIACAIFGFLLPTFWLSHRSESRKIEIFHAMPDVLDLLTVCVEAGLSLNAALIKTAENFQQKSNPLIQEINIVIQEIRVGKPRPQALKSLADRTMVEDLKAFVAMLIQTEKFGTSLGKTLRTYSDSLRMKRKQLAEERAAKTGIKMLLPLTFCVFPALLVVMLTPAFFKIAGMFSKMAGH